MSTVLINGAFFCRRLTGIERYALEITKRLDKISKPGEITIILPKNAENVPTFVNFEKIVLKKNIKSHLYWQMITLQFFLLFHRKYVILDFGNTCLPLFPGIVFLHDIYQEFFPGDFTGIRDKIIRFYSRLQYRLTVKKAKKIISVSEFTKNQIITHFAYRRSPVQVIYSSWEHFKTINDDDTIFDLYPELNQKAFYFSLGSLSKRKNLGWIIKYAVKHPSDLFVVSGSSLPTVKVDELNSASMPENVILLGYINDGQIKSLMKKCKAFILPSYYEGFGLTPLEALSCGAKIIVSNAASLPEIYKNTARYIDPYDTDTDLDALLETPVDSPEEILGKYSYDKAAEQVYEIIKEFQ